MSLRPLPESALSRRDVLRLLAGGAAAVTGSVGAALAERFVPAAKLKAGEFQWRPEASPAGAVVIRTALPAQLVHVYRGGREIGVSACSAGKPGHRTPTGIFTILEKERKHVSSIYKGAQMPNMERLTWGGIALHAGNLPGFPASHGCIRLPLAFSALLFEVTHVGCIVIVADERTQPASVVHPGALLSRSADAEARAVIEHVAAKQPHGPWDAVVRYPVTSVVISRNDGMAFVTTDGVLSSSYPVDFKMPRKPLGTHAYSLVGSAADGAGLLWLSFGLGKSATDAHIVRWQGDEAMQRIVFHDEARARQIAMSFHPGSTLLITDASAHPSSRKTPKGFSVMASETS